MITASHALKLRDFSRCQQDLLMYLNGMKDVDVGDISFSQNLPLDRLRVAAALAQIAAIKKLPILHEVPIKHKVAFYRQIRSQDVCVAAVEGAAIHYLRILTGLDPINIGSFGLMLNIQSSDIDLGIGLFDQNGFEQVCHVLIESGFQYKQARDTRYITSQLTTKRFVFNQYMDGLEIDVSVYHHSDLALLSLGGYKCRTTMQEKERAEHTWNKFKLKDSGLIDEYTIYKLEPYMTYKPGFRWVSID